MDIDATHRFVKPRVRFGNRASKTCIRWDALVRDYGSPTERWVNGDATLRDTLNIFEPIDPDRVVDIFDCFFPIDYGIGNGDLDLE